MKDDRLFLYKTLFEYTPNAVSYQKILFDQKNAPCEYALLNMNPTARRLFHVEEAIVTQKKFSDVCSFQEDRQKPWFSAITEAVLQHQSVTLDLEASSIGKWLRVTAFPVEDVTFGLVYVDITNEVAIKTDMALFLAVSPDMLCVTTQDARFMQVNAAFEQALGYTAAELENQDFMMLVAKEDRADTLSRLESQAESTLVSAFVNQCRCKNGDYKYLEWRIQPFDGCFYAAARDITEKIMLEKQLRAANEDLVSVTKTLRQSNQQLQRLASVDKLTGAYNRYSFDRRVTDSIEQAENQQESLALILFDLDRFKKVNDQWGHPVGDAVLQKTVQTAASLIRDSDTLNRIGGEEFAVLMPKTSLEGAQAVAEKIRAGLEAVAHAMAGQVTASFGVAEHAEGEPFLNWYRRADSALYRAKNSGRNCVRVSLGQEERLLAPVCLEWRDEWACGDVDIDAQHRELLTLGNQLLKNAFPECESTDIRVDLKNLLTLLAQHFGDEEKKLSAIAYPEYKQHQARHKTLLAKADGLSRDFSRGKEQPAVFFSFLVNDVVLGHMLKDDLLFFGAIQKAQQANGAGAII